LSLAIYDSVPVALCVIDRDGRFIAVNASCAKLLGRRRESILGRPIDALFPSAGGRLREEVVRFDAGQPECMREFSYGKRVFECTIKPVMGTVDGVGAVIVALADITARKRAERSLRRQNLHWRFHARHDYLTGLLNRRCVDEVFEAELRRSQRTGAPLSLLLIDVDFFKKYNDWAGHIAGDACLRVISRVLLEHIQRDEDIIGRYGGEEFIVILPGSGIDGASALARTLIDAVHGLAIEHAGSSFGRVTLSIGVATLDKAVGDWSAWAERGRGLLSRADLALYAAKDSGRNMLRIYPASAVPATSSVWKGCVRAV
jgi:diguanylate cyclase (GGDEF)-like protein/PAS domain S-box-containing protein